MLRRVLLLHCSGAFRNTSESPCLFLTLSAYSGSSENPFPRSRSPKRDPFKSRRMIDQFKIRAIGGSGGHGCASLSYNKQNKFGKPDGGDGGRGGDVILECCPMVYDYKGVLHHINAKNGDLGRKGHKDGKDGEHKIVQVPIGTVIHLVDGEVPQFMNEKSAKEPVARGNPSTPGESLESHLLSDPKTLKADGLEVLRNFRIDEQHEDNHPSSLCKIESSEIDGEKDELEEGDEGIQYNMAELTEPGQKILIARGGEGGAGNSTPKFEKLYKKLLKDTEGSENVPKELLRNVWKGKRHDIYNEQRIQLDSIYRGRPGTETNIILELKSIADVGLVGIPNAGKSTLLSCISKARPEVANYAFTTLRPNLGSCKVGHFFSTIVADIPGLIKGAHRNRGLGHAFLRHIERTKVLVYVLDLVSAVESEEGIPPWEQLRDLVCELEFYKEGMSRRPCLVVANKVDEAGAGAALEELRRRVQGVPIFPTCAVLEEGVPELKEALKKVVSGEEFYCVYLDCICVDSETDHEVLIV